MSKWKNGKPGEMLAVFTHFCLVAGIFMIKGRYKDFKARAWHTAKEETTGTSLIFQQ